jgi:hypothetical protein
MMLQLGLMIEEPSHPAQNYGSHVATWETISFIPTPPSSSMREREKILYWTLQVWSGIAWGVGCNLDGAWEQNTHHQVLGFQARGGEWRQAWGTYIPEELGDTSC